MRKRVIRIAGDSRMVMSQQYTQMIASSRNARIVLAHNATFTTFQTHRNFAAWHARAASPPAASFAEAAAHAYRYR